MKMLKFVIISLFLSSLSLNSFAQAPSGGGSGDSDFEIGVFVGNILPNLIPGMEEIHPQGGLRAGWRDKFGGVEFGLSSGKAEGVEWTDVSASYRVDVAIDTFIAMVYVGTDYIRYEGVNEEFQTFVGAHIGGGLHIPLGGPVAFRIDMKFNGNPGTSLLLTIGTTINLSD